MNNNKIKSHVVSGFAGGLFVAGIIIVLLCCCKLHDYSPIYILNNSESVMTTDSMYVEVAKLNNTSVMTTDSVYVEVTKLDNSSVISEKVKLLKELESKGILLTPHEYTSQISSYYNTIITFLIALFVIFSFIGYFSIRLASKQDVQNTINELMDDSVQFRNRTTESIITIFSDSFVRKEELDGVKREIELSIEDIKEIMPANEDHVAIEDEIIT